MSQDKPVLSPQVMAIVAEWKDWIPYPDSHKAEWDRFILCAALAPHASAQTGEKE